MRKRSFAALAVVLLYCAGAALPVSAHALLVRSTPAANAVLESPPPQVELYFSEALEPSLSSIAVFDSSGQRVDAGDFRVDPNDPTRATVSVRYLVDGVYTVAWKALSAVDGHLGSGSFPFAVGSGSAAAVAAQQQQSSARLPASALIAKWMVLVALALIVGFAPFAFIVWGPALQAGAGEMPDEVREPPVWRRIFRAAYVGLFLGLALSLLSEAGQARGIELAAPWAPETSRLLLDTRLGAIWLLRLGLALLGVWFMQDPARVWKTWAGFGVGLALLLTISLTSHAATQADPALPVLGDWLHMIGMSFWFGGLAYLLTGLRVLRKLDAPLGTGLTALVAKQFSAMAIASVGVVGLTGLYAASLRVGSIQALFTTLYGSALLIKQGFVALLLLLAGTNLLVIRPRLERARAAGTSGMAVAGTFGKMVLAESVLACLLLLSVSLLSYLPPGRIIPRTSEIIRTADADDLGAHLAIAPGYVGQNTFTVHLTSDGEPLESAKEVLLRFTPAQDNIPPSEIQLLGRGNGEFVAKGSNLSLPGEWQVQLVVRREKKFDTFANFDLSLAGAGGDAASQAIPRFSGAMLLLDGLLIAVAVFAMRGRPGVRIGTGAILGLALVSVGVSALTHLPTRPLSQANPIVPSAESVAAGKAIYDVRCGPCHGVAGKGDGPLGLALNPRPADLTLHAIPGVHTDAQLFDWITNGFPGSAMPAFRSMLSDTDRWNLVNFIRTFAPK